ncbi:cupin domain-containing protein [Candidatus Omnitrophota bacterium]
MLRKRDEQEKEVREHMRGGDGQVVIRHFFKKEEINAPCRLCAELSIPPGGSIGVHEHLNEDEIFIIQKGKGVIISDEREIEVEAGDSILTGRGASHAVKNTGDKDLLITAVIIQY